MNRADYQEYVPGGDFRTLLNNSGVLKEEHARFYAAEMFMGVNELHKLGYIHRDLKPEVHMTTDLLLDPADIARIS